MSGYHHQGPPPQGGYNYGQPQGPPQQGYGPPPNQPYGGFNAPPGPPPNQYGGGFNAPPGPPPQGYGPPPGQHQQQWGPPPGAPQQHLPPHQQYNQSPPTPASPGYDPNYQVQGNAVPDAEALRKAMKGFGTDEKALIHILTKPDANHMTLLRNTYAQTQRRDLEKDVASETSSYFKEGLVALVRGPLVSDCHNVHDAIKGLGTKENVLNDVLLGRSNADLRAIKHTYQTLFHKSLESDVSGDLSMKTDQFFKMVMAANRAEESTPIDPMQLNKDVEDLHHATAGFNTDPITAGHILATRSDGQLRAIDAAFKQKYQTDLEKKIKSAFTGHIEAAYVLILRRAVDRAMCDAEQLEETMAGMGTKDSLLVQRIVRVHWTKQSGHMDQVKRAYQHRYKKDLIKRIQGETRGDYEKLMVACVQ